jgi:hypothetical protein
LPLWLPAYPLMAGKDKRDAGMESSQKRHASPHAQGFIPDAGWIGHMRG